MSTHLLSEIDETNLFHQFHKMKNFIDQWILDTRNSIIELNKKYGKIYGKSFPGRAAILIKLLNIDHDVMPVIYEKNGSMKLTTMSLVQK